MRFVQINTQYSRRTLPGGIKRPHIEDIDALHLSDELQTLKTGGLLEVGWDLARLGTGADQFFFVLDLCSKKN